MLTGQFLFRNLTYLVVPYYAGPKPTPAHFTPALITPIADFDLPPFRAAFNATISAVGKLDASKAIELCAVGKLDQVF